MAAAPAPPPSAVAFPGQGGDWRAALRILARHRAHPLVQEVHEVLGADDLASLDPLDTRVSQPVVLVAGLVAVEEAGIEPGGVAVAIGHSLGEITAACFAGAMTPSSALELVRRRADLGHAQHQDRPGAMAAMMRLDLEDVEWIRRRALAEVGGVLDLAVVNSRTQLVLSGDDAPVARAVALAEAEGAVSRRLPIGGAFHSTLMWAATEPFAQAVRAAISRPLQLPVVLSTAPRAVTDADQLPALLARSLVLPVQWPAALAALRAQGVEAAWDAGPGDALTRLARHEPTIAFVALPGSGHAET